MDIIEAFPAHCIKPQLVEDFDGTVVNHRFEEDEKFGYLPREGIYRMNGDEIAPVGMIWDQTSPYSDSDSFISNKLVERKILCGQCPIAHTHQCFGIQHAKMKMQDSDFYVQYSARLNHPENN